MFNSFHLIGFPSEWGATSDFDFTSEKISFHLIGFPSEWGKFNFLQRVKPRGFPFNWVPQRVGRHTGQRARRRVLGFHLIGFPSEWGERRWKRSVFWGKCCFHLIGFPSEWGDFLN